MAWILRDSRVTSTVVGASSVEQLLDTVGAVANLDFTPEELQAIDTYTGEAGINIWEQPSTVAVSGRRSGRRATARMHEATRDASRVASSRVSDGT